MKTTHSTRLHSGLFALAALFAAVLPLRAQTSSNTIFILTEDGKLATAAMANVAAASAPVTITNVVAGDTLVAIDVRTQNQQLYALGVNAAADTVRLYHIAPETGFATPLGAAAAGFTTDGVTVVDIPTTNWDMDFNPAVDRVRVVSESGLNFRLNPNTGAAVDGDNGGAAGSVAGLNPDGVIKGGATNVSAAAYTNNQPNNGNVTTLYTLDAVSNSLFIQTLPNTGTQTLGQTVTLGGNPLDFSQASFDIAPGVNAAASNSAVTSGLGTMVAKVGAATSLYTVNLATAQATLLGSTSLAVRSSAIRTDLGAAIALSGAQIIRFDPATPGTLTTISITGITAGETLVGIDGRPATGQLMGLGVNATANTATLYLLDPRTAAATAIGSAGQITFVDAAGFPVDLPDPATTGYGFDFNPTVDRIRVIVGSGLNFRVNPNTGAPVDGDLGGAAGSVAGINTDGSQNGLSSGSTGATGAAYTNSFGQSLTGGVTTLYTLDATSHSLYIQNPANVGTQTNPRAITLGGSQLNFTGIGGFDIASTVAVAASGTAAIGDGWMIGTVGGITSIFRLNLATGAATSLGTLGAGSSAVAGLVLWAAPAPEIAVSGMSLVIVNGDTTPDVTDGTKFGTVAALHTTLTHTFTITNSGTAALTLTGNVTSNNTDFTVTQPSSNAVAANGGTVTFGLTFDPSYSGGEAIITIPNNDADESAYTFTVQGTGDTSPVILFATKTAVPNQPAGTTFTKMKEVGDAASSDVALTTITLPTGKKADALVRAGAVILKVGDTLAAADSATVATLSPMSNGALLATLKVGTGTPKVTAATSKVVLREHIAAITLIARSGDIAPGGTAKFKSFRTCAGTDAGDVFFEAKLSAPAKADTGLYTRPASGVLKALVLEGQMADVGLGSKKISLIAAMTTLPKSPAEGRVIYNGSSLLARLTMEKDHAIVAIPATATGVADWTVLARTGGTAPGGVGTFLTLGLPAAEGTNLAFQATLAHSATVTKANDSILVASDHIIAREGSPAPDTTANFAKFNDPAAGADGQASFTATLAKVPTSKATGLWEVRTGNVVTLVARTGDTAPGTNNGITLASIKNFAQPASGRGPIFTGTIKGTGVKPATNAVLWGVLKTGGPAVLLVRTGDTFVVDGIHPDVLRSFTALHASPSTAGTPRGYTDESVIFTGTFAAHLEAIIELPVLPQY